MDNLKLRVHAGVVSEMTDILIVGGGLAGPALALAAARSGLTARILDAAPEGAHAVPDFDGRAYALTAASRAMLAALGIWPELEDAAQPILDIRVGDARAGRDPGPLALHFDHAEIGTEPMGHIVEDRHLRAALARAVAGTPGITVEAGARVTAHRARAAGVEVTLADGSLRRGRMLVAADGRGGTTAPRAGIARFGWDYRQTSLVAALEVERPHGGLAQQMFFPQGPLAILPLRGERVSIVWTEARDRAAAIQSLDDAGYADVLRPRFGHLLGGFRLAGSRYAYPLSLSLAARLTADRLALVGDAAHGIHPLAGQGLNLSLRDVATLAEVLVVAARRGEDIGAAPVLERYAAWRRADIAQLALATDTVNRVFSNANPVLRAGRVLALGAIRRAAPLRRAFMREAAGLTGDRPALLRGEPL